MLGGAWRGRGWGDVGHAQWIIATSRPSRAPKSDESDPTGEEMSESHNSAMPSTTHTAFECERAVRSAGIARRAAAFESTTRTSTGYDFFIPSTRSHWYLVPPVDAEGGRPKANVNMFLVWLFVLGLSPLAIEASWRQTLDEQFEGDSLDPTVWNIASNFT